jgi:hypothetical protein
VGGPSWMVADDAATGVRYVVVTSGGSQLSRRTAFGGLHSDLVTFESPALGAKVNRWATRRKAP